MSLDLEDIEPTTRTDYRRANGAPQVVVDGKGERYSRPSSFADPLDDKSALTNWRIDRGCIGVARDRALQARWCAIDPDDKGQAKEKEKLRQDSISSGRGAEAADIGTALHAMSVRWENEDTFSPPEPYLSSLMAYEAAMHRLGLRSERFEFHVVNVEHRCAGTADRLYLLTMPLVTPSGVVLEAGTRVVGDLKTGGKFEFSMPSYAVQMALYAGGQFYNVVTDEFEETPTINQEWGLVVHMPANNPGECEFLWCDLEVGRYGAYIVDQVKLWRKNWRAGEFEFAIATTGEPEPTTIGLTVPSDEQLEPAAEIGEPAAPGQENSGLDDRGVQPDELTELIEWAKVRLSFIARNEAATNLLLRLWPKGLPTPKQGVKTVEQANEVLSLLSKVEAEYELGFVEGGPVTTGPRKTSTTRRK